MRENVSMRLHIQCYAGRKANERPLRFTLNDHEYLVEEVIDQWYGPEHAFFKLRADDGNLYILRHQTSVPDGDRSLYRFVRPSRHNGKPFVLPVAIGSRIPDRGLRLRRFGRTIEVICAGGVYAALRVLLRRLPEAFRINFDARRI